MRRLPHAFLATALLALVCGCSTGTRDDPNAQAATSAASTAAGTTTGLTGTPAAGGGVTNTTPGPSTGTAPSGQVGSRFWDVGDVFGNPLKTHDASEATFAQEVLTLTNQERVANGLAPLQDDTEAELGAKAHCEDMVSRNFFDHFTPEGWSPNDRLVMLGASGYTMSGENIAFGQRTPTEVVDAWMNSPGHRANILHPAFTHMGVGVAGTSPTYWGQVFTTR